jgi:hypothetical protein
MIFEKIVLGIDSLLFLILAGFGISILFFEKKVDENDVKIFAFILIMLFLNLLAIRGI